jgi:prevent-host-death family protein
MTFMVTIIGHGAIPHARPMTHMCYFVAMTTTGLRQLRQQASELVRQAEAGEIIIVTVNGREVAQLGPIEPRRWRRWEDIAGVFAGGSDHDWAHDQNLIDQALVDPFVR